MKALPCPFCGKSPDTESGDFIYPIDRSGEIWSVNCNEVWGGCSASILGGTPEEVLLKWNRRKDPNLRFEDGVIFKGYRLSLEPDGKDWAGILNNHPWR